MKNATFVNAVSLGALLTVTVYGCTSNNSPTGAPVATPTVSTATLGMPGGHVATSDGSIDVFLPYGALTSNVALKSRRSTRRRRGRSAACSSSARRA